MILTINIAVGAAWSANIFGLLGPGLPWLLSLPGADRRLPPAALAATVTISMSLTLVCLALVTVRHTPTAADAGAYLMASAAIAALTARAAWSASLTRPTSVRLGSTGATVVAPLNAMIYTLKIVPFAGAATVLILSAPIATGIGIAVGVICWSAARAVLSTRRWDDRNRRASLLATVSSG